MKTKLTLTIDEAVLQEAKQYSRVHNRSLSALVEIYLKKLSGKQKKNSVVDTTRGILKKAYAEKTYDQLKEEMYKDKYGI